VNLSDIVQAFAIGAVLAAIVFGPLGFAIGVFAVLRSFERMDKQGRMSLAPLRPCSAPRCTSAHVERIVPRAPPCTGAGQGVCLRPRV
jgi:hypothetical protein